MKAYISGFASLAGLARLNLAMQAWQPSSGYVKLS